MEATTTPPIPPIPPTPRLSGRRAQAARNNQIILDAARAVFTADPGAPIAAVAQRAGVGMSALYRRFRSKEELLQRLSLDGLRRYIAEAEAALADEGDSWNAFARFMRRCLDAGTGSLTVRFMGSFPSTAELNDAGRTAHAATQQLLDRTKATGALRADIEVGDISLIFEQLQAVQVADPQATGALRYRYLALFLDGLQHVAGMPLPGPPPTWEEISGRYNA